MTSLGFEFLLVLKPIPVLVPVQAPIIANPPTATSVTPRSFVPPSISTAYPVQATMVYSNMPAQTPIIRGIAQGVYTGTPMAVSASSTPLSTMNSTPHSITSVTVTPTYVHSGSSERPLSAPLSGSSGRSNQPDYCKWLILFSLSIVTTYWMKKTEITCTFSEDKF